MLIVKSKYRIAKRLGAGVFDQTQTQKFALREANAPKKRGRGQSDYGRQLLEKQRVRFTYGLSEKQLSNYAKEAYLAKDPSATLHTMLEMRLDTTVYRAGLASTRRAARQAASHGHFMVNGVRVKTPSYKVKNGDKITVREGARKSPLYAGLVEKNPERSIPNWLSVDINLLTAEVKGLPQYAAAEGLDYSTVFEFYSR
jgi:small subunit ribosomal protein S4